MSAVALCMLSLAAQGKEPSAQCIYESRQCKTDKGVGQSKENDEHCGRMLRFCQETGTPLPLAYGEFGLHVIDRAIGVYAARHHMPIKEFKDNFATALVDLPNMICVGMVPFMATGGGPTICFDKSGEKIVLEYNTR